MAGRALSRLGSWFVLVATGVGCSSGPSLQRVLTVRDGEPTVIALRQGNLLLTLRNESAGLKEDVYKQARDTNLKVAPDGELQALLDVFAEEGLFARAANAANAGPEVLQIEQGDRVWSIARPAGNDPQGKANFHQARQYFLAIYNGNVAFHGAHQRDANTERPNFSDANARAKADAEAARERLLKLRREAKR